MSQLLPTPYVFDLELSGLCNTWCSFCPREEMKRGENYMSAENFEHFITKFKSYSKVLENREVILPFEKAKAMLGSGEASPLRVIMCGMGESLMHKNCPEWIGRIRREVGARVSVVTNGLLLKPGIVSRLKEAQVTVVLVSIPGIDKQSYSRYMKIDWDKVIERVEEANEVLPGRIQINATIPDDAEFTPADVTSFWGKKGIPIAGINNCHNRGGFLSDSSLTGKFGMSSDKYCGIITRHNFISWDGRVLSCCHDLHGDNVFGHVAADDFLAVAARKLPVIVSGPDFKICQNCNDCERGVREQMITIPISEAVQQAPAKRNPLPIVGQALPR
jgi:hypothetical protein